MLLILMANPEAIAATNKMETRRTIVKWEPFAWGILKILKIE